MHNNCQGTPWLSSEKVLSTVLIWQKSSCCADGSACNLLYCRGETAKIHSCHWNCDYNSYLVAHYIYTKLPASASNILRIWLYIKLHMFFLVMHKYVLIVNTEHWETWKQGELYIHYEFRLITPTCKEYIGFKSEWICMIFTELIILTVWMSQSWMKGKTC